MKSLNKGIILGAVVISAVIVLSFFIMRVGQGKVKYLSASWSKGYESIEELVEESDLIALVRANEIHAEYVDQGVPFTEYKVEIIDRIYSEDKSDEVIVVMTGGTDSEDYIVQVEEDPLMKVGEEFLLFARRNSNGTYTILGGPQGRFIYEDGTLSSLANRKTSRMARSASDHVFPIDLNHIDAELILSQIDVAVNETTSTDLPSQSTPSNAK